MQYDFDKLDTYGRKFIVEPQGTKLTDDEREGLSQLRPAGVMFRSRNFLRDVDYGTWLAAYADLVKDIRDSVGRENLILAIDHEGGRVVRPPAPITRFPYPAKWSDVAGQVGEAMGRELRSLGLNLSFAPVADIHSNPANPVINQRAFGRTVAEVESGVIPYAEALKREGVASCAKHFPGHGDTSVDSHFALPVLPFDRAALAARELIPFKALIDHEVPFIMTAHLMLPAVDPANIATFSRTVLTDLLRGELGFKGVVIADAMGMKAVVDELARYETTVQAMKAGLDLYCVAGDVVNLGSALSWAEFMRRAVSERAVDLSELNASFDRVEAAASLLPAHPVTELPRELLATHAALAAELDTRPDWGHFELRLPGFE